MKLRGGYDVLLAGRPSGKVEVLPEPQVLRLPLRTARFEFSSVQVKDGDRARRGQILAKDPANHGVPLLAPREGTVRLEALKGHVVLEDIVQSEEEAYDAREDEAHVPQGAGSSGIKRFKLLALGAWQFFRDAHDYTLPDPFSTPRAVVVSTLHLEPFTARGDVQLHRKLASFTRGLEHLQSLLEYQPIYLVLPDIKSEFARKVRETIRGYAWAKQVQVPLKYPFDNSAVLARMLGFGREAGSPVWAIRTEGVLAVDRALTLSRSCDVRMISLGGPRVSAPAHLRAMPGYPLEMLLAGRLAGEDVRVINGGVMTGAAIVDRASGLPSECAGLTVLAEHRDREFLGFVRPGWSRRSYSRCFLSALRRPFREAFDTAVRGERRACVACGACEEVCPAGILPHWIHKLLYQDELEEAERARVDLCVGCGLCSFVCPSKIELLQQFLDAQRQIRQELHAATEQVEK